MATNLLNKCSSPKKPDKEVSCIYLLLNIRKSGIKYYMGRQEPEDIHNFLIYCSFELDSSIKFRKIRLVGNWHNQKTVTGKLKKALHLKIL